MRYRQPRNLLLLLFAMGALGMTSAAPARAEEAVPPELAGVGLDDHLGQTIPLDLRFTNEQGEQVPLARFFQPGQRHPVVIIPVYYSCPSLCNFTLNGVVDVMKQLSYTPGKEFEILSVSFDPAEGAGLAAAKKESYLKAYGRPEARRGWHWMTGDVTGIKSLMDALGFRFRYDTKSQEYLHSPAVYILTPSGKISRYFSSIYFEPADMKLALVEASDGRIGSIVDRFILYCSSYDHASGRYSLIATRVMQAGGILTVLLLGGLIGSLILFERRRGRRVIHPSDISATTPGTSAVDAVPLDKPHVHAQG